jgi:hypothetical protein
MWGALSDERTGLSFTTAAGPRQRSHSRVRVPLTVSDSRLPFTSPPTTRRVTVEVFDPSSTRDTDLVAPVTSFITPRHGPRRQHRSFSYAKSFPLPRERVYRAVAQKQVWYNNRSHDCCVATAIHATILILLSFNATQSGHTNSITKFKIKTKV